MYKTEAFLRTLFTLGMILFILWMIQNHSAQDGLVIRPVYQLLVLAIAMALAPFVYRIFLKRLSQKRYTRDDYLKQAIASGCIAVVLTVLAILNLDDHKTAAGKWLTSVGSFIAAAISLFLAYKAKRTEYTRHE